MIIWIYAPTFALKPPLKLQWSYFLKIKRHKPVKKKNRTDNNNKFLEIGKQVEEWLNRHKSAKSWTENWPNLYHAAFKILLLVGIPSIPQGPLTFG